MTEPSTKITGLLQVWNAGDADAFERLVPLDDALTALERADPHTCRVVELRFFAGLSTEETADVLGVSTDTVSRDWKFATSGLFRELRDGRPAPR